MRVFSYVIDHDLGFAPNPFHGVCSLAACKPRIRRYAKVGDYVMGLGSKPNGIRGKLSYWMRVDEIIGFDAYWADPRFRQKRPFMLGSLMQRYGDNIYHHDGQGEWIQEDSFHSEPGGVTSAGNLKRDTATTDRVLLGRDYAYWGADGPAVPQELEDFVHPTQGHRCIHPPERHAAAASWLVSLPGRGLLGRPANWPG
ncbi:MAG: hypothetical protein DI565_16775 [Ancylobacter novellus]|uniref:Nucleotide modification associated domain-containing protein n=1 Tax=Ancylobacter novellus TaxID=921 RepID=A0A2W5K8J1_ANCNO|nr:MAG: hypothetical protein DI565_16775 [Ancylobacter novellus]